jgi:hypothetical protein
LLELERFVVRDKTPGRTAAVYTVGNLFHGQRERAAGAENGNNMGALVRTGLEKCHGPVSDTDNSRCGNIMDVEECGSGNNPGAGDGAINRANAGAETGTPIASRKNTGIEIGDGAESGATARAGSEKCPGPLFDTVNSRCGNMMDVEERCSGSNPGAVSGAASGAGSGAEAGASRADSMPKRLESPKPDVPPRKPAIWRWTCDKCGADSVGMVPAGVVPPPAPCLKAKWGRCDGTAYPELEK